MKTTKGNPTLNSNKKNIEREGEKVVGLIKFYRANHLPSPAK